MLELRTQRHSKLKRTVWDHTVGYELRWCPSSSAYLCIACMNPGYTEGLQWVGIKLVCTSRTSQSLDGLIYNMGIITPSALSLWALNKFTDLKTASGGQTYNSWHVKCSLYEHGTISLKKDTNMLCGSESVFLGYGHRSPLKGGHEGHLGLWVVFNSIMLLREMGEGIPGLWWVLC